MLVSVTEGSILTEVNGCLQRATRNMSARCIGLQMNSYFVWYLQCLLDVKESFLRGKKCKSAKFQTVSNSGAAFGRAYIALVLYVYVSTSTRQGGRFHRRPLSDANTDAPTTSNEDLMTSQFCHLITCLVLT